MLAINTIHNQDALEFLKQLDAESVNCIVTSPPYNLLNSVGNGLKGQNHHWTKSKWRNAAIKQGYGATYDDNMPHEEYVAWQRSILAECMRVLRPDGAIFYNHKWRVQGGLHQSRDDIVTGFPVRQIIIWDRGGSHLVNPTFFLPVYEVIYLICKPYFKLQPGAHQYSNVWRINPEAPSNPHPAPFPQEIPYRCIVSACPVGGLVCDPFMGSGTTALVARRLGRDFIGCELNPEYHQLALTRLTHTSKDELQAALEGKPTTARMFE